jgi:hypothetical protein
MSRLTDQQYQVHGNEIQRIRKITTLKPRRKIVFASAVLLKITMSIFLVSLLMIIWELLAITNTVRLVKQQGRRIGMYWFGIPTPSSLSTDSTTTISTADSSSPQNQLLYAGSFGIGHRMNKLSCVHHMLSANKDRSEFYKYISIIKVEWGTCPSTNSTHYTSNVDIFEYLFASQYISMTDVKQQRDSYYRTPPLGGSTTTNNNLSYRTAAHNRSKDFDFLGQKTLWIRNDVAGYFAGQSYKNAKIRLHNSNALELFHDKLLSDNHLFQYLIKHRFIGYNHVQQYKLEHEWDKHYVMGIHIRAGNGEQNHFVQSGRNIVMAGRQEQIVEHIAKTIHQIYINVKNEQKFSVKPPLVFLATDTEYYIQSLTNALRLYNMPLISFNEQPRIPKGMGVSYDNTIYLQQSNISCYQSWYGSMIDMTLLSESDTVIATTRSTFTQILPNSVVFHRAGTKSSIYKYCEMDLISKGKNTKTTCFQNQTSWLLRNNSSEWNTFCVEGDTASVKVNDCNGNSKNPVTHKLMVHFPDIGDHDSKHHKMYRDALAFLKYQTKRHNDTIYYYGKKYNRKYRFRSSKGNPETIQSNWTWE